MPHNCIFRTFLYMQIKLDIQKCTYIYKFILLCNNVVCILQQYILRLGKYTDLLSIKKKKGFVKKIFLPIRWELVIYQ